MAELDEPGDEPNFDLFGSFGLDFFSDDELLLTETDLTEQTEIGQLNDEDIDNFITENRNKNTTKKTQSDLNVFYRWAKTVNETRTLENISEQELDKLLAHFVLNARKQNGDEYEPDTLTSMLRSFDRLLREKGKHYSILTDRQFAKAREALSCKRKQLRRAGKGQKPNKALGLSETQIQKLWDEKQLGCRLLIARIFPRPRGARENTTQLAKYPHVLYAKPSNKVYLLFHYYVILPYKVKRTRKIRGRNTL